MTSKTEAPDRWPQRETFRRAVNTWRDRHRDASGRPASAAAAAKALGCNPGTLRQYARVLKKRPSLAFLERAAAVLEVPLAALVGQTDQDDVSPLRALAIQKAREILLDPNLPEAVALSLADSLQDLVQIARALRR